jgi:hypothetical protein
MPTNFKQMQPADILKADALEKHQNEMAYFHHKLSELHHSTYFIQQIVDFPFDLFVLPAEDLFLRMTLDNLAQVTILQITKLTTDNGKSAHTLGRFKTFMETAVKDEMQADYRRAMKEARFKPRIRGLIEKAKNLRDLQIAHSVSDYVDAITFTEITEILAEMTKLFEVASFDAEYRYLIFSYDPTIKRPPDVDRRTDIERILDGIARDSPVLHEPERNPVAWPYLRQGMSPQKVEQFNRYRKKCGLQEV